ncbi:twitching motility protein [Desulfofarcimen acetoxidans DSM 771]|uniref:Twitching motility protein n=1 Tax=Desulfofarcimen acetoxidans (strain ATCC 49208 / DSM 771 / KCTC 5769 / VKM B-1644 / 5575) TaxID=485916 RepID=C8W4U3_DESAS|nr:type IV pilus twitching motility protein PilT [Desulfofarcimen acetoxidans]ACV63979.1 twitching motility protein [Desulfofarcimen acetoxidans DSM 771]
MDILQLLQYAVKQEASDLHVTANSAPVLRLHGNLTVLDLPPLLPEKTLEMARQLLDQNKLELLEKNGEVDSSYNYSGVGNFRINVYYQRGAVSIAVRVLDTKIPTIDALGLPDIVKTLARRSGGLILITGPTGSGKSTTMAAMVDLINKEKSCHILTLEDPIEYLHINKKSIIEQREIGKDSRTFPSALRAALRQDPDVILVGEMRDLETISIAVTAAETGHLILATLHTMNAPQTVSRIIDAFDSVQQKQIRMQLSNSLVGIISQRLLPRIDGRGRLAAMEILVATPAVRNLIRENKLHQIFSYLQAGSKFGMQTMDSHLQSLYNNKLVNSRIVLENAADREAMLRYLGISEDTF